MACKYTYNGQTYTKDEFYSLVKTTMVQPRTVQKYNKVLFPTGDTAAKIEGHETVEEFIKEKESRKQSLLNTIENIKKEKVSFESKLDKVIRFRPENYDSSFDQEYFAKSIEEAKTKDWWVEDYFETKDVTEEFNKIRNEKVKTGTFERSIEEKNTEIQQLEKEIEDAKTGKLKISSIANFYENTIANILKKQGYNPERITDEYGNSWYEVDMSNINTDIQFSKRTEERSKTFGDYKVINGMPFQDKTLDKMSIGEQRITIRSRNHASGNYQVGTGKMEEFNIINLGKKNIKDFKNPDYLKKQFKGEDYEEGVFKHIDAFFKGEQDLYVYQVTKIDNNIKAEFVPKDEGLELVENKIKEDPIQLSKTSILFQNQINRLTKQIALETNAIKKQNYKLELEYTKAKFEESKSEDKKNGAINEYGSRLLSIVDQKIKQFEEDKSTPTEEDMNYIHDVLDVFKDLKGFRDLGKVAGELSDRMEQFEDDHVNEVLQKVNNATIQEAKKQNKDIDTFKMGTGSLLDLDNLYANTIGKIIRSSQTKIERANKAFKEDITNELNKIDKAGKNSLDVFKELIKVTKSGKKVLKNIKELDGVSKEAKDFHTFYQKKLKELMEVTPTLTYKDKDGNLTTFTLDEHFIPNVSKENTIKDALSKTKNPLRLLGIVKSRKVGEFTKDEDQKADIIPLDYIKSMPHSEKSDDLGQSLYLFASSIHNYEEMSKTLPKVRILQREIEKQSYIQPSNPSKTKTGEDSNMYKIVDGFIRAQVKGEHKLEQGRYSIGNKRIENKDLIEDYIDVTGTIDNLLRWNSLKRIGLSPVGAVANAAFGKLSNWIEAVGGQFFTRKDLRLADVIFMQQTFSKDSVLNKELLSKYNVLQELTDYELQESVKSGKNKYLSGEKLQEMMYWGQKSGEKYIQSTSLIAMMLHDGLMDSKGNLTEKWNNLSEDGKEDFILKVTGVNNKLHGRYSPKESAIWQQHVLYRAISQFRKFIPAAIEARFDSKHFDKRLQAEVEGRYKTFARLMFSSDFMYNLFAPMFKAKEALESGKLTANEIANMRKMMIESVLIIGTLVLASIGKGDSDEDKKRRKSWQYKSTMLLLNRISGDLTFFYSPEQLNNLAKNAVPMSKLMDDLIKIGASDIWHPTEKLKAGNSKGKNKLLKRVTNVIPGSNIYTDMEKAFNKNELDAIK